MRTRWVLAGATALLYLVALPLRPRRRARQRLVRRQAGRVLLFAPVMLSSFAVGWLLVLRRAGGAIGWLLLVNWRCC